MQDLAPDVDAVRFAIMQLICLTLRVHHLAMSPMLEMTKEQPDG